MAITTPDVQALTSIYVGGGAVTVAGGRDAVLRETIPAARWIRLFQANLIEVDPESDGFRISEEGRELLGLKRPDTEGLCRKLAAELDWSIRHEGLGDYSAEPTLWEDSGAVTVPGFRGRATWRPEKGARFHAPTWEDLLTFLQYQARHRIEARARETLSRTEGGA